MKRLLQISTVPQTLSRFIAPISTHFRALGWQVDAMSADISHDPICQQAFDHTFEATWSRNPADPANFLMATNRLRTLVEENAYDIVHVHTPVAAFLSRFALRGLRKRGRPSVIYTAHGFHFHKSGKFLTNNLFLGLEKLAGSWTDYLVVMNQEDHHAALNWRIVPEDRIHYMPGIGVDTRQFSPRRVPPERVKAIRRELQLGINDRLFLMIGEFIPRKRHADLVRALAQLANPHVHVAFAGTGKTMDKVQHLTRELGLLDQVHFLGQRNDIPELIRASFMTVLPSEQEGLPRCILESLSMGTPVLGSNVRGIKELIDPQSGRLFALGNIQAIADQMDWCLEHPAEIRAMGQHARQRMTRIFDSRFILELHEKLYAEALQQNREHWAAQHPWTPQQHL